MKRDVHTRIKSLLQSPIVYILVSILLFLVEAYLYLVGTGTLIFLSTHPIFQSPEAILSFSLQVITIILYFTGILTRKWRVAKYYGLVTITLFMLTSKHAIPSSTLLKLLAIMLVRDTFFSFQIFDFKKLISLLQNPDTVVDEKSTVITMGKKTLIGLTLIVIGYVILIEFIGYVVSHASTVVSAAVGVLEEPLASFWNTFLETKIGHVLALITVAALLLVALDMIMSTILYSLTITKSTALEEAQTELRKWFTDLRDWKTWHQRMIIESGSVIVGLLFYPVLYIVFDAVLMVLDIASISNIKYLPTIVSIGFYILAWGAMRRYLRSVLAIGKGALKPPSYRATILSLGIASLLATYLYIYDPSTLYALLGKIPAGTDPLSKYWSDQYVYNRIENLIGGLDAAGRLIIKLFWG